MELEMNVTKTLEYSATLTLADGVTREQVEEAFNESNVELVPAHKSSWLNEAIREVRPDVEGDIKSFTLKDKDGAVLGTLDGIELADETIEYQIEE